MDIPAPTPKQDPWDQRAFFLGLLDAKVEEIAGGHIAKGVSTDDARQLALMEIARELGLESTAGLEHSYRYDKARRPKPQVMEKAAPYFGVQLWQIYGPKPVAAERDELTLAKEALAGAMGLETVNKLTDEQILSAYRVAMTTAKAMLAQ